MIARPEGLVLLVAALAWPLAGSASMVQGCCTHQGQNVTCPAGLPPGSGSVRFMPGGTEWAVPGGGTVFVPQSTFAACTSKPPPSTPTPPTSAPTPPGAPTATPTNPPLKPTTPAATPTTPAATPTKPASPASPGGATPPTSSTQPTPPASGTSSSTPGAPSAATPSTNGPRWPIPPAVGPQETDLQARPLNEPDTSGGGAPMKPPGGDAKAVGQSMERVKKLREEQERAQASVAPPKACGPDVTDYVLAVLQMIQDTYDNAWNAAERSRRCGSLYGLGFQAAWDLQGFTPSDGEKYMPQIFFQRAAPSYCAIPRDPCGATAVFLGFCVHAQVMNYVQWGLMNELCGTQVKGRVAQSTRSVFSSNSTGQQIMSDIGADFKGSLDLETKKRVLKGILDTLVRQNEDDWYAMEGTDCPLVCDQSLAAPWLENFSWGFQWGPEDEPITKRGSELKKP